MLAKLKQQFLGLKKVAGVEAILSQDGIVFNLVIIEKNKNLISITEKKEGFKNLEELVKALPKGLPVALSINGRGVINKKIAEGTYRIDQEILSLVFPNAKIEDFFLLKYAFGKQYFISVIRKNILEDLNKSFENSGTSVINVSIGPFVAQSILPFINDLPEAIQAGSISLLIKNNSIYDFASVATEKHEEIKVGEENLKSSLLISYSVALSTILSLEEYLLDVSDIVNQKLEFNNKVVFKTLGYFLLGFFVLILLVNYLFYNYYKGENSKLSSLSTTSQSTIDEIKRLEKKIEEKEYFMKKAGWLSSPKTSYFADEIAASIPASIKLNALKVNPVNDKLSKRERKDIFQSDTILVGGECNNPTALNPWMNGLKEKPWVKGLSNLNYSYDPKTGSGYFEIEIRVDETNGL